MINYKDTDEKTDASLHNFGKIIHTHTHTHTHTLIHSLTHIYGCNTSYLEEGKNKIVKPKSQSDWHLV